MLLDLDRFKSVNDRLGHQMGDKVLIDVAADLKKMFRNTDVLSRLGGDEFIIVAKTDVESQVQSLCSGIKSEMIRLNEEAGAKYELTASIGYSSYCGDIVAFQNALAKADEALYEEKKSRR